MPSLSYIILIFFGFACAFIASIKGRSPLGWFFTGCFLHVAGLFLLIALPDLKQLQEKFDILEMEIRTLRVQIQYDRQKSGYYNQTAKNSLNNQDNPRDGNANPSETVYARNETENTTLEADLIACPNCGKINPANSKYCNYCAAFLEDTQI